MLYQQPYDRNICVMWKRKQNSKNEHFLLLKKFIFRVNFVLNFFLENIYKFCYEKKL